MKIPAEFEDILRGVELTEREKRFLRWITSWDDHTMQNMRTVVEKVRSTLSTLQTENERLRAAVDNWKKKYVEANGKWIEAENKWAGLDKAVRNGTVYRPMQEELNLTHEENQSLKDAIEKLRAELERVKKKNKYSAHDVALILSDAFGDSCACNFNGNDEWLPEKCELLDTCPDVVGVACWEQYLKWLGQKED